MDPLLPSSDRPPNPFTVAVGKLVRQARQDSDLTQGELARLAAVHRNTISNVEAGKVELSVSTLVMLAQVLDRPLSYFIPMRDMVDSPTDFVREVILLGSGEPEIEEPPPEIGLMLVQEEVPDYEEWKAKNALKLAQVLAWVSTYSTVHQEPTDAELADVRAALLEADPDRQEFTVKEIAEEWIRQNGGGS